MAAPLVFRREWIVQIEEMLNDVHHEYPAILRVPPPLLKMKPEAYIPQLLSFGPYHHSRLEKLIDSPCAERNISMAEACKGKFAARFSQELRNCGRDFKYIIQMMKRMRPEIERFYGWPTSTEGEYSQNFALLMAIDSSFLLQLLITVSNARWESKISLDSEMSSFFTIYISCILYDIAKLENQIPLSVMKGVFQYAKEALISDTSFSFNHLWTEICYGSSPFLQHRLPPDMPVNERISDAMANEPHFLGAVHRSLSGVLSMKPPSGYQHQKQMEILLQKLNCILKKTVTWINHFLPTVPETALMFPNGKGAVQLARAGIKFKSFSKMHHYIRLDTDSGTLYLPHIIICDIGTEVWLRNMLALEFNDALRPNYVTQYVALMGNLIQSPDDVRMLVHRHVISRGHFSLTDECIAKLWHDVRQPFLLGSINEVQDELQMALAVWSVTNYWKNTTLRKVREFYDYVSSWKFIAPVAAFLGLLMTAIQTYCSLYQCNRLR